MRPNPIGLSVPLIPPALLASDAMSRHDRVVDEARNGTTAGDTGSAGAADGVGSADAPSASSESIGQGPLTELPDAVPGFVGELRSTVEGVVTAGSTEVGDAVSGIASDAMVAEAAATATEIAAAIPV